jgi:hypothetical protein
MNRREVRAIEFAQQREWAERFTSDALHGWLTNGQLHSRATTAARYVLRGRGELTPRP